MLNMPCGLLSAFGIQLDLIFHSFTKEEKKAMDATKAVTPLSVLKNTQNTSVGLQLGLQLGLGLQ